MNKKDMMLKYRKQYEGVDIPDRIIEELIRIDYHEQYFMRKDPIGKAIFFGNDIELYKDGFINYFSCDDTYHKPKFNCPLLYDALTILQSIDLVGYELIMGHYFSDAPKSSAELASELGVKASSVYQKRYIALRRLKRIIVRLMNNS